MWWSEIGYRDKDRMEGTVGGYDMYNMPRGALKGRGGAKLNKKPEGQGWAWVQLATLQAAKLEKEVRGEL